MAEQPLVPKQFKSPEEELDYLRRAVKKYEDTVEITGGVPERDKSVSIQLERYKVTAPQDVLHPSFGMHKLEIGGKVLELAPEPHDTQVEEILKIAKDRGIRNAISIAEKTGSAHLIDDVHRALVSYVKAGLDNSLKDKEELSKILRMTLYEIMLPERKKEDERVVLKELLSSMEQFYSGMLSVANGQTQGQDFISIELAIPNVGEEYSFYVAVPDGKKAMFEKHVLGVFPDARFAIQNDDYNIYHTGGEIAGSYATLTKNPIYPLRTYDEFDHDPINVILNSFSKIKKEGEGASIQLIFKPAGEYYIKRFASAIEQIQKGTPVKKAIDMPDNIAVDLGKTVVDMFFSAPKKKDETPKPVDQATLDMFRKKTHSSIVKANLRILVSAPTESEANLIISDIESSFNQLENTQGNSIKWKRLKKGDLSRMTKDFSYRTFDDKQSIALSLSEVATFMHFHTKGIESKTQLKFARSGTAPAPAGLPTDGVLLGVNKHSGREVPIYMRSDDRVRHMYTIGQTGTGKSTFLKSLIAQDIKNGEGVCMIDPHGSDIQDILAMIPPERYEDVIYFDPSNTERPMALNMLEYDRRFPEQKTFVVNELLSIFNKLFDMKVAGGPMFEQYFRNSVLLVMEDPDTGNTLLDVSRVLADKAYRDLKLSRCKNPVVVQYWREVAEKAGGEASLQNVVPYITSKFDVFLSNDIMRPVIAQEKSSFNFREVMDQKKILLVNLSKGRLGDINAHLIGLIIVGKILMAALSRVDSFGKDMPQFYLYLDEFQNITTDSIATILSEARKYKLALSVAHQFIAQLEEKIKDAVFGNVGSIVSFRVGAEDAEYLEKQFSPVFGAKDIMNIENRNAIVKLLVNGSPVKPFSLAMSDYNRGDISHVQDLIQLSSLKYGKPRDEVEAYIHSKYNFK